MNLVSRLLIPWRSIKFTGGYDCFSTYTAVSCALPNVFSEVLSSIGNQSMSSMSSSSTADELLQLVPRHSSQATEHSSPIFLHVHLRQLQSISQLQWTIFSSDSGAAGKSVVVGASQPSSRVHPHCCGFNARRPIHTCTW